MVTKWWQIFDLPEFSSSKHAKAFRITSSGSVPFSFSPNIVRNIVKLIGPGASAIISSRYLSVGSKNQLKLSILIGAKFTFSKWGKHVVEIISINESVSILINHIERFFEFLRKNFKTRFCRSPWYEPGTSGRQDGPEDIWLGDGCIKDNKLPGFDPEQTLQRHLKLHVVLSFLAF